MLEKNNKLSKAEGRTEGSANGNTESSEDAEGEGNRVRRRVRGFVSVGSFNLERLIFHFP